MWEPSTTNKALRIFAYVLLISSILAAIFILANLKTKEPDLVLSTGYVIEGDEISHPLAWLYALIVFIGGTISSLLFFAISEILTRLQYSVIFLERSYSEIANITNANIVKEN